VVTRVQTRPYLGASFFMRKIEERRDISKKHLI
jgi:hypothetical protein